MLQTCSIQRSLHRISSRSNLHSFTPSTFLFALRTLSTMAQPPTPPEPKPQPLRRSDYAPSAFALPSTSLDFIINSHDDVTVKSKLSLQPLSSTPCDLTLDGVGLDLKSLSINSKAVDLSAVKISSSSLMVPSELLPQCNPNDVNGSGHGFTLEAVTQLCPRSNLSMEGLYVDGCGALMTQCEASGFRRITYGLDRPDVLSVYTVSIEADKKSCPVLLSNGNLVREEEVGDGRHRMVYHDPFMKPSYLFAMVAGDLGAIHSSFMTMSGREVKLHVFAEQKNIDQLDYAMQSLKQAMAWDEKVYGLEYDLDVFNVVASDSFNMGAMENKSLNIFNTIYVQGRPDMSTDSDLAGILCVIGHEYFHNWTGNRVTCRDWFQLTLKEGLTVFRDQTFTEDETKSAVKRIDDVRTLRAAQFPEDAGAMAHPIRPEEVLVQDNFYTSTVYEKGAEVIRMYRTLLGTEGFRKGMDLYFERHDGQAVTCDDFRSAMAAVAEDAFVRTILEGPFERWYDQAGTPHVYVTLQQDADTCTLSFTQQTSGLPTVIPICFGFLDPRTGQEESYPLVETSGGVRLVRDDLLVLHEASGSAVFKSTSRPCLSLFRAFSAPVKVTYERSVDEYGLLMVHDSDPFIRFEAAQQYIYSMLLKRIADPSAACVDEAFLSCLRKFLLDTQADPSLIAVALTIPGFSEIKNELDVLDPHAICEARRTMQQEIGSALFDDLVKLYERCSISGPYRFVPEDVGKRRLAGLCLSYLSHVRPVSQQVVEMLKKSFDNADNMTQQATALSLLCQLDVPERQQALDAFEQQWRDNTLVMNKWFRYQAVADLPNALERIKKLMQHELFTLTNPNKLRSVVHAFCVGNPAHFHDLSGSGYEFLADMVREVDPKNPQMGASLAKVLLDWKKFEPSRQGRMKAQIEQIIAMQGLSSNTYEVCASALKDDSKL